MKRKLLALLLLPAFLFANTAGPNGGTGASGSWTTPTNIATTNAVYSVISIAASGISTGPLSSSAFGFTIPVGSTINGIQVDIVRHCSAVTSCNISGVLGAQAQITKVAATGVGTILNDAINWGTTDATTTFGGSASLLGLTWTVSDINSSGFGFIMSVENANGTTARTASVDSILITVTFTPPVTGNHTNFLLFASNGDGTYSQTRGQSVL